VWLWFKAIDDSVLFTGTLYTEKPLQRVSLKSGRVAKFSEIGCTVDDQIVARYEQHHGEMQAGISENRQVSNKKKLPTIG